MNVEGINVDRMNMDRMNVDSMNMFILFIIQMAPESSCEIQRQKLLVNSLQRILW
ncbi:hypothetical protein YPPY45_1075 [Yersinia pestis PY-45]|nr:hypothetical protein YPPY45_1075 [Yersinia pestis PY-45]EIS10776.1 hypothetical protein YPPY48_1140 [Yersinia pestis PY-48]EIT35201.1 hypothetical protein YPPY98_1094 [Yersinia pestis PY-98]